MILFIKQIDIEGPETFKEFFEKQGVETSTRELYRGESLPKDLSGIEAVVALGGPMNVYEEEKYPFLKEEHAFIKNIIAIEMPFIGICLGSQLLAKACEAKVVRSPEKEIGFFTVGLTAAGKKDPLLKGLEDRVEVFQWHEDMWELPPEAELLAFSDGCPQQAFKIGPCAYGLQFHIEVTQEAIGKWMQTYFDENDSFRVKQKRMILEDYQGKEKVFLKTAEVVYNNFLSMIREKNDKKHK